MSEQGGDTGGTALSTAWILHILGIVFTALGLIVIWFLYSLASAFAIAIGATGANVPAVILIPTVGFVVAFASAFVYAFWARPSVSSASPSTSRRIVAVGVIVMVAGAAALPAFVLGGVLLIVAGLVYALAPAHFASKVSAVGSPSPSKSALPTPPGSYTRTVWVRCTNCAKPVEWPSPSCPRCGDPLSTYR